MSSDYRCRAAGTRRWVAAVASGLLMTGSLLAECAACSVPPALAAPHTRSRPPGLGAVSGLVRAAGTNRPVGGACVYLFRAGSPGASSYDACTSTNGRYSISRVVPGRYDIVFADPLAGYLTQWYNGTPSGAPGRLRARAIYVGPGGGAFTANASLVAQGEVAGVVTSASGHQPIAHACAYLFPAGGAPVASYTACTLANGSYRVAGTAFGRYYIAFADQSAGYVAQWYNGTPSGAAERSAAQEITISPRHPVARVNAALAKRLAPAPST